MKIEGYKLLCFKPNKLNKSELKVKTLKVKTLKAIEHKLRVRKTME